MRYKNAACLILAVLLMAGSANAGKWVAAIEDPNLPIEGMADWNVAGNWDTNLVPVSGEKVQFSATNAVGALITSAAACGQLVVGDGGANPLQQLTISNGGTLNTYGPTTWAAAGYNRAGAITVEKGGALITQHRLGVGLVGATPATSVSYLNVNGGLVDITGNLQIGEVNHKGIVNVNSGTLKATNWEWRDSTGVWSFMDISLGTVMLGGDRTAAIPGLITANALTGFGGRGTIVYDYNVTNPGMTTVTAVSPLNPYPAYKQTVLDGDVPLAWTNLDPNFPGDSVWVDVWFGTEPNKLSLAYSKVVPAGQNTDTVMVNAPVIGTPPTTYYWQVDSYIYGDPAVVDYDDPQTPVIESGVFQFNVTNVLPPLVQITTPRMITWVGEPIQLNTQQLQGAQEITYLWTSSIADPNIVFLPSNTDPNPTVTVDYHAAQFTVTVTVDDGFAFTDPHSASLQLDCAANPCQAARAIGYGDDYPGDIAGSLDCKVNLADFARIASEWLTDYSLTTPVPLP